MNYRERWFAEQNLEYFDAPLTCPPPWQCIGGSAGGIKPIEKKLRPPVRSHHEPREMGEDSDADVYGER